MPEVEVTPTDVWTRVVDMLIKVVALLMIAYHVFTTIHPVFNDLVHQNIHLGFALVILFLCGMKSTLRRDRIIYFIGLALSLGCVLYMHFNFERLDMWSGSPELRDFPVGLLLPVIVLAISWVHWGAIFTCLAGISVAYALFGHHLPGALGHSELEPSYVMSMMGVGYRGIYGVLLNASAILIMPFIIFGSAFESVGINRVFIEVGNWIGARVRGGSAQIAIISSTFVSMCTGAAMANVALTGSYTIPLMKQNGYKPEQAGAIEAVASTGGQITPPVMGVSIFIMANFLGIGYQVLMVKAIPSALIYMVLCIAGVMIIARRENLAKIVTQTDYAVVFKGIWVFLIPMFVLVSLLINRFSPAFSAYTTLVVLLVIGSLLKETRPTVGALLDGLVKGVQIVASLAIVCAAVGIFVRMLILTGAGIKLAGLIEVLSGGNLLLALFMTMVLSIIMGCALPTVPAYAIVALVVAPALVNMGVDLVMAHFFVFYYAVLAVITPPVAPGSIVASKIAGASFMKTSWEATKLAAPFFLVPYFIIFNPVLVLEPQKDFVGIIMAFVSMFIACGSLMFALQKWYLINVTRVESVLLFLSAALATMHSIDQSRFTIITAVLIFGGVTLTQINKVRLKKQLGLSVSCSDPQPATREE
ncbi:MAG: TRAP transporter fused permease subunit [Desulforhopalus sp.]